MPRILPDVTPRCTGCGRCVAVCPPHVLWLEAEGFGKRVVLHDPAACTGCAACVPVCPFDAIRMRKAPASSAASPADPGGGPAP